MLYISEIFKNLNHGIKFPLCFTQNTYSRNSTIYLTHYLAHRLAINVSYPSEISYVTCTSDTHDTCKQQQEFSQVKFSKVAPFPEKS